jgi:chromosome partitioning protein
MVAQALTSIQTEDPADKIIRHAGMLSEHLQARRQQMYPPDAQKSLRHFLTHEVSKLTSIPESTLKLMSNEG